MSKPVNESDFFDRVWDVVAQIPYGRVTTYGHIAEHLGTRSASRAVGWEPAYRDYWGGERSSFSSRFQDEVDQMLSESYEGEGSTVLESLIATRFDDKGFDDQARRLAKKLTRSCEGTRGAPSC